MRYLIVLVALFGAASVRAQCLVQEISTSPDTFTNQFALGGDSFFIGCSTAGFCLYERSAGVWSEVPLAQPPSGPLTSKGAVAVDGNRAVITQRFEQGVSTDEAFVYERVGGVWTWVATIPGPGANSTNFWGLTVALSGDTIAVGAPMSCVFPADDPGLTYVYERSGTSWQQTAIVMPSDGVWCNFGIEIELDDDTLLVSRAPSGPSPTGEAYVFERTGTNWTETAILKPADLDISDQFGVAMAIDQGRIAIGSPQNNAQGNNSGAVYVFEKLAGVWTQTAKLLHSGPGIENGDCLGADVSLDGDTIVAGAPRDNFVSTQDGTIYVFEEAGGVWTQTARLGDPTPRPGGCCGYQVGQRLTHEGDTIISRPAVASWWLAFGLGQPTTYCTAKLNSLGCLPTMTSSGTPSTTDPTPFYVGATNVLSKKSGILFYGVSGRIAVPLLGGTLCVAPPFRRVAILQSGGNPPPTDCSGVYSFDFSTTLQAGLDPFLVPGRIVNAQYWTRDPAHPDGTGAGLTDGLELQVCL